MNGTIGYKKSMLIMALVLIGAVFLGFYQLEAPVAKPKNVSPVEFSAGRAMKHVQVVAQKAHPTGSDAIFDLRDYIVKYLTDLGFSPQIQRTLVTQNQVAAYVENITAKLEGTASNEKAVFLVAHYDSVPFGTGAADDGSGVAALLETARAIKAGPQLKNDLVFLFTDGEELGLFGAMAFAGENPLFKNAGMVFNMEARGNGGPSIMFETSDHNEWLIKEFRKASPYPLAYSFAC